MDEPKCSQHNRATCTSRLACMKVRVVSVRAERGMVEGERGEGRVRGRVARSVYAGLLWSVVADECMEGVQGRHSKGNKLAVLDAHLRRVSVRDRCQVGNGMPELGPCRIFHQLHLFGPELGGVRQESQARCRCGADAPVFRDGRCRGGASSLGGLAWGAGKPQSGQQQAASSKQPTMARGGAL